MTLREDLYQPIPGERSTGSDLRYSPVYEKIREARRQDENLEQGVWKRERKLADYSAVVKLAQEAIATQSKDLQLAVWLTEALLAKEGFPGLENGLRCCLELLARFGNALHPASEDGDLETLAVPLEWLGFRLDIPVRMAALNSAGHNWFQFKDSRTVGYEEKAKDANQKKTREKAIKDGKLAPEDFDKAFEETPKSFYAAGEKALDNSLAVLAMLDEACTALFADSAPGFTKLRSALEEVRHGVHQLLEKKRETEADPVTEAEPEAIAGPSREPSLPLAAHAVSVQAPGPQPVTDSQTASRHIAAAAAFLRKKDPCNPASYLMLRGLRWGELRHAARVGDPTMLESPSSEARREIKLGALEERWQDLLEASETLMAHPCSRAWLDLQRLTVQACVALGPEFDGVAKAIRSELKTLLADVPQLLTATLMDDSPAANADTQAWLRELLQEHTGAPSGATTERDSLREEPFRRKFVDPFEEAKTALKSGDADRAFLVMRDEITRQHSGRGKFLRKLQLVKLCVSAGKEAIAQPILEDLIAAFDAHKVEEWEERETVAEALLTIMSTSKRIQSDSKEKQKYFDRICRLDPVKALATGS